MRKTSGVDQSTINRNMRVRKRRAYSKAKRALDDLHAAFLEMRISLDEMGRAYHQQGDDRSLAECQILALWITGAPLDPRHHKKSIAHMISRFNRLPEEG